MKLSVNIGQRYAKMRAHTATHLLHAELAQIFPQTKQAWSLVDEDYLRFDFYADQALTDEQLGQIEQHINQIIAQGLLVETQEMSYNDAIQQWAKAFFEDKYDDTVRMVMIWKQENKQPLSVELCGGTHVSNTSHIGAFTILSQESVAAWTKRIIAVTWPKVSEELRKKNQEIRDIAQLLWVQEKQIVSWIQKLQNLQKLGEQQYESLVDIFVTQAFKSHPQSTKYNISFVYSIPKMGLEGVPFKNIVNIAKNMFPQESFLIYNKEWWFALQDSNAKQKHQELGLKWGWSDNFIQWKDPKILDLFD